MSAQSTIATRDAHAHSHSKVWRRDYAARSAGFVPHLFIGIGETAAYFTLRETHQEYIPGEGPMGNATVNGVYQGRVVTASHHIKNLSQDAHEAFEKAREYADGVGLELRANVDRMKDELREIHRATAEQIAARQAQWRVDLEIRAERERQWIAGCKQSIDEGLVPFGRYAGVQIAKTPIQYRQWIGKSTHENEVMSYLADVVARRYSDDFPPSPKSGVIVGTIGERLTFRVRCLARFIVSTDFGDLYITKLIDLESGALLVVKSGSWSMKTEDAAKTIKATVKKHDEYRGEIQTVLQRIKEVAA